MILGITIRAEFHWGYWIRVPFTSKAQPTLSLPPPTTLIGALASGLVKEGLIKDPEGKRVSGEIITTRVKTKSRRRDKIDFRSPASLLDEALIAASAALTNGRKAFMMDDLSKYVTLLFQEKIPEEVDGEKIPRRYLPKYRAGAINCGKVYYPSGPIDIVFLFDAQRLEEIICDDPVRALIEASWSINRIGSKESLVIVRNVAFRKLEESDIAKGIVMTRFYFPSRAGRVLSGDYYTEVFWRRGWGRLDPPIFEEYIVPGSRSPVTSSNVIIDADAYIRLDGDTVIVFSNFQR
ncbi:MAG: type I-A CRISPR-associated protein Cas5a [Nitrososphaerota archaeon]